MPYVDGFVVPVPKKKLSAYRRSSKQFGKVFRRYGALEYHECVADDVKWGKRTSFPRSVKRKSNETVVFSYVVYRNRAQRDRVNKSVMKDKRAVKLMQSVPFDGKRMIYGGFKTIVAL